MAELRCLPSSSDVVVYRAEVHRTRQANLSHLLSLLRGWVSEEPSFLVQSQLVRIDSICFTSEEICTNTSRSRGTLTESPFSTYTIIGVTVGVALVLTVSIIAVVFIIVVLVYRRRNLAVKSNSSRYNYASQCYTVIKATPHHSSLYVT